jgi:outer membrane protein TolC
VAVGEAASWYQLYRARQREVISQLKRAFYQLGYIDTTIQINEEERSLLEHHEGLAQTRYATGQGLQQAVIKIQAEITRVIERLKIRSGSVEPYPPISTPSWIAPRITRYPVWNG